MDQERLGALVTLKLPDLRYFTCRWKNFLHTPRRKVSPGMDFLGSAMWRNWWIIRALFTRPGNKAELWENLDRQDFRAPLYLSGEFDYII